MKNRQRTPPDGTPGAGHRRRDLIVGPLHWPLPRGRCDALAPDGNGRRNVLSGPSSGPFPTEGMAAYSANGPHKLMKFQRRALGPKDVAMKIHYCGICHSDIHTIRGDWGKVPYPLITGHELAGEVVAVGSSVRKFRTGARVGVGTMVDSCGVVPSAAAGVRTVLRELGTRRSTDRRTGTARSHKVAIRSSWSWTRTSS